MLLTSILFLIIIKKTLYENLDKSKISCPPGASGLYPHPNICTQFLQCSNGVTQIQDCGPGTAFDSQRKVCDVMQNVICASSGGSGSSKTQKSYSSNSNSIKCPSGASGLYPHPYDCTKFLQCANGATYIQDCGPGTGFDSIHKVCDYKEKVNCASGNSGEVSKSVSTYGKHEANEFEDHSESVECPYGVSGLYPHPHDCEKFLQCTNDQTYVQSCGPGTGFDSVRLVCDYKEKVQCGSGSVWGTTTVITTEQGREFEIF